MNLDKCSFSNISLVWYFPRKLIVQSSIFVSIVSSPSALQVEIIASYLFCFRMLKIYLKIYLTMQNT